MFSRQVCDMTPETKKRKANRYLIQVHLQYIYLPPGTRWRFTLTTRAWTYTAGWPFLRKPQEKNTNVTTTTLLENGSPNRIQVSYDSLQDYPCSPLGRYRARHWGGAQGGATPPEKPKSWTILLNSCGFWPDFSHRPPLSLWAEFPATSLDDIIIFKIHW